jgi:hypothetical protein
MRVAFETWGTTHYPTNDGRQLEITEGVLSGEMKLGFEFRDPEKSLPTDALACEFRTADREGQRWATTSRFTTAVFITHMFDFSASRHMNLFRPGKADDQYKRAFKRSVLLRKARCSRDDRFYRTLLIDDELITTKFKYTRITFDVAAVEDPNGFSTELAVKVHKGSLVDEEEIEEIGDLGYYVACQHLLRHNTGVFDPLRKYWRDSPLPMPLVFTPTGKRGVCQENVRVVDSLKSRDATSSNRTVKKTYGK